MSGIRGWLAALSVYRDPRILAVLFMGFSSGLPLALTGATLAVRQTEAGVSLTTIGFFALVGVAYNLKFVWAPLMDALPPPGPLARLGRRRGWAITTQLALMMGLVLLGAADPVSATGLTAALAVAVAFFSASQDIVIDAYRVELLEERQQAAGAAATQYGYRLGMLAAGAGALFLAEAVSWFWVYVAMAALVTIGIVTVLLTPEPALSVRFAAAPARRGGMRRRVLALLGVIFGFVAVMMLIRLVILLPFLPSFSALTGNAGFGDWLLVALNPPSDWSRWFFWIPVVVALAATVGMVGLLVRRRAEDDELTVWLHDAVVSPFAEFAARRGWLVILLFIVLYKLGDAFAGVMANPFYIEIGFSKAEIAWVSKIFGLVATLVGVFLGGLLVQRVGIMAGLLICGVLQMLSNLTFAAQAALGNDLGFLTLTISIENLSGGMGSAAFVAYLSALCNVRFTATQYALFSSLAAVGRTMLASSSGWAASQLGWVSFFVASTFVALPGLLLLLVLIRRHEGRPGGIPAAQPAE